MPFVSYQSTIFTYGLTLWTCIRELPSTFSRIDYHTHSLSFIANTFACDWGTTIHINNSILFKLFAKDKHFLNAQVLSRAPVSRMFVYWFHFALKSWSERLFLLIVILNCTPEIILRTLKLLPWNLVDHNVTLL